MKNIKRLFCLLLVAVMLFTSGIVEVLAAEYRRPKQKKQSETYKQIQIGDVSDLFVVEETEPEPELPETQPPEVTQTEPVETQPAQKLPAESKVIKKAVSQDFVYSVLSDNTCRIDGYTGSAAELTIPDTLDGYPVTVIGNSVFYQKKTLKSITLPDSVTSIKESVFRYCTALESVQFGSGLISIGSYTFNGCKSLTEIHLPDSVESLGNSVFDDCTNLSSFTYPTNLKKTKENGVFNGCSSLVYVEIPEGVTDLAGIFLSAEYLKNVKLPSTLKTIGANAFRGSGITSIEFPSGLTTIGHNAFENVKTLTTVILPDSITEIGSAAFRNCTNLVSWNYPQSLKTAGNEIFKGCTALKTIEVPEGVTDLPNNVFKNAESLQLVKLPSTLKTVGFEAFYGCGITSIVLPDSVKKIGYDTFKNCRSLEDVKLSSGLTEIGSSAFQGCTALESIIFFDGLEFLYYDTFSGCTSLKTVHLPRTLEGIAEGCFEHCVALSEIYIPNSVTYIGGGSFYDVPEITFLCDLKSYAAEVALNSQIPIIPTQIEDEEVAGPLNTDNSYYIHNLDGVSAAGVMSMTVHYEMQENADVAPTAVTVHMHDYAGLQENTLTLDGVLCTNYEYDINTGKLTVPVEAASGTLRFCMKPLRYEALTSYARLIYTDRDGNSSKAVIGYVNSLMPALNISAQKETSMSSVKVYGIAVPEAEVSLYVDDVLSNTVKANKVGDYSATVSLGEPVEGKTYIIRAEAADRTGSTVKAETDVTYRQTATELKRFVMIHSSQKVSLLDLQGKRPVVTFVPNKRFRFEVEFTNADSLSNVYVVSTRNGVKKYLEAFWDEELGLFVAEGFFDSRNHSYVPGEISVEYVEKREMISFDQEYDFSTQEMQDILPQVWKDADIEILENTENGLVLDITAGDDEEQVSFRFSINYRKLPDHITEQTLEENGYIKLTDDYGKEVYVNAGEGTVQSLGDSLEIPARYSGGSSDSGYQAYAEYVDVSQGVMVGFSCDRIADAGNYYLKNQGLKKLAEKLDIFGKAWGVGFGIYDIYKIGEDAIDAGRRIDHFQNQINSSPNLTAEQKKELNGAVTKARIANTLGAIARGGLAAASIYASLACPVGGQLIVGMGTALLDHAIEGWVEGVLDDLPSAIPAGQGAKQYDGGYNTKWAIDPSGYVYDAETGERLSGVTVHAYWIENTGEDPDFWEKKPGDDEYGVLWDSVEFSQMNPLITDGEGRYAWDVPEGWWRVSYEKEGYESTWSQWLPVPPPQTEVNIGMQPISGAIVGDLTSDGAIDNQDVEYLLWFTLFPEDYPLSQNADYNGDGAVDNQDVEYLLWYTLFPEDYPLQVK